MADDLAKKGMEVRTALFGEKAARAGHEYLKEFDEGFANFLNEQVFGYVWARPGLPTKTRSYDHDGRVDRAGTGPGIATCICAARSISG